MLKAICCSNCAKVGRESYSQGYMDAMQHLKNEIDLAIEGRPRQLTIVTNDNTFLIDALKEFVNLANNIEAYGAMKFESDWVKVRCVRDIALKALDMAIKDKL